MSSRSAPANLEYGEWAVTSEMNATYAYMYNTLAHGLPTQMDESAWRLVYGPSGRNRSECWSQTGTRNVIYRAKPPSERIFSVKPPRRADDAATGRSFSVQYSESFLCGTHSLDNVANQDLFRPDDHLSAIEAVRRLPAVPLASPEELCLMALREGIFLLPIKLVTASDLNPIDFDLDTTSGDSGANKCFLQFLEEARGMVVYQQYADVSGVGHFVSLCLAETDAGGVKPENRWLVYSTGTVVARGATPAAALDRYILDVLSAGVPIGQAKTREERRRKLEQMGVAARRFVGLLPMSLRQMREHEPDSEIGMKYNEFIKLVIERTLVRRSLSEFRVTRSANAETELTMPTPISPSAIDELCWLIKTRVEVDADNKVATTLFKGDDQTNIGSFVLKRHQTDYDVLMNSEQIAQFLVTEIENRWSGMAIAVDGEDEFTAPHVRYERVLDALGAAVGALIDPELGLGLLFTGSSPEVGHGESFEKFARLLTNRRWLRYITARLVGTALIAEIRKVMATNSYPLRPRVRQLLVLFTAITFRNLKLYGVKIESTPMVSKLLRLIHSDRESLLPLDLAPEPIADMVRTDPIEMVGAPNSTRRTSSPFLKAFFDASYDWFVWTLRTTVAAQLPDLVLPPLDVFEIEPVEGAPDLDDMKISYDERLVFVKLLRTTLFQLPATDVDYSVLEQNYFEQDARSPTRPVITAHYRHVARQFMLGARQIGMSEDEALAWIDLLAFDPRFAIATMYQAAAADISTHVYDVKPRFVERGAQAGFTRLRRDAFGKLQMVFDTRAPITNNINRLPLPRIPGNWTTTAPRVARELQLCARPLHDMPAYVKPGSNRPLYAEEGEFTSIKKRARPSSPVAHAPRP